MSKTPNLLELAAEMAERNERCGHVERHRVCLRQRNHQGEHQFEHINSVIPMH